MNHPSRENWMAYLYGELAAGARADLEAHLRVCPECKSTVAAWRATQRELDGWMLPKRSLRNALFPPLLKWGMAAALVLGLGFGLGRVSSPGDLGKIRAALVPELRQQLQQEFEADWQAALAANPAGVTNEFRRQLRGGVEQFAANHLEASSAETQRFLTDFVQSYNATRAEDHQALLALFQEADQRRRADDASLRKALETVAVVAEGRLDNAQQEIGQLAAYTQPEPSNLEQTSNGKSTRKSKGN
jgi:hypothetical protein